jgi:membrane protein implicated in regulation of membrane protease activity
MSDPRFLVTFAILFLLLGLYNAFNGYRRLRRAQEQGIPLTWYKQTLLLVGLEYILLSLVFLVRIGVIYNWLPKSLNGLIIPFYIVVLIPSAVLAGLIVRQGIASLRQTRQGPAQPSRVVKQSTTIDDEEEHEQRHSIQQQHRRERRQKAAAARRRRTGRA